MYCFNTVLCNSLIELQAVVFKFSAAALAGQRLDECMCACVRLRCCNVIDGVGKIECLSLQKM